MTPLRRYQRALERLLVAQLMLSYYIGLSTPKRELDPDEKREMAAARRALPGRKIAVHQAVRNLMVASSNRAIAHYLPVLGPADPEVQARIINRAQAAIEGAVEHLFPGRLVK